MEEARQQQQRPIDVIGGQMKEAEKPWRRPQTALVGCWFAWMDIRSRDSLENISRTSLWTLVSHAS
jgi:hypothetical protein